jgi:hypothetical protein
MSYTAAWSENLFLTENNLFQKTFTHKKKSFYCLSILLQLLIYFYRFNN